MTHTTNDAVIQRLSGLIRLLISLQKNGITIKGSHTRSSVPASPAQHHLRSKFQQAVSYARSALANEPIRLMYRQKAGARQTAHNIAIADFFRAPQIGNVDINGYHGRPGDTISIAATDDFQVVAVKVKIESGDRSLSEEGEAILQADGINWLYTAFHSVEPLTGTSITVTASDLPGHFSTKQTIM